VITPLRCIISFGTEAAQELLHTPKIRKKINLIVNASKLLQCQFQDLIDRKLLEKGLIDPVFENASVWVIIKDTLQILNGQI